MSEKQIQKLLICDDDSLFHMAVKQALRGKFDCKSAYNGDEALAILSKSPIDVVMLDVQMRTPDEGLRLIPRIRELDPGVAIVMSSGMTDFQTVREAMRLGATDYVPKDFDPNDLEHTLRLVLERRDLLRKVDQKNYEVVSNQKKHVLIGNNPAIGNLRKMIDRLRSTSAHVVITGETGTGKEVVARQLRGMGADGALLPFVAIDSSTIQSSTAESMLFGHEKGAFTGAEKSNKGVFEEANGGIVYFDEIANMPLEIQAKLLRVIQEKEVVRLGSSKVIELDFRVICATNKDLEQMVRAGQFKEDLFQRLNVIPVSIPPLRERKEDLPLLIEHFVKLNCSGKAALRFTEDAIQVLQDYEWPGNIRELGNLVAYLTAMVDGPEIDVADLPPRLREKALTSARKARVLEDESVGLSDGKSLYLQVESFEKGVLDREYSAAGGNISKLALKLGMDRSHLYSKLKQYKIHPRA